MLKKKNQNCFLEEKDESSPKAMTHRQCSELAEFVQEERDDEVVLMRRLVANLWLVFPRFAFLLQQL